MGKTALLLSGYRHNTGAHPECADRLRVIEELCDHPDLRSGLVRVQPRAAALEELSEIHDSDYILRVKQAAASGVRALDPDTFISPESFKEALLAAGGVLSVLDAVVSGEVRNGFCAVRPPGHHAERGWAKGFCLFNNIAVAARYAQKHHGIKKVLIVDWDVHHGNGTQNAFYADPTVFYFSLHQYPHYPGSGARDQTGAGAGRGFTRNIPLPAGSGDPEYRAAFEKDLIPAAEKFAPDLILISAGFDGHAEDPLAGTRLTEAGYRFMTETLTGLADRYCGGRLVSVLEGGYNLSALQRSVKEHLSALIGSSKASQ